MDYAKYHRVPELDPHCQMQVSVIPKSPFFTERFPLFAEDAIDVFETQPIGQANCFMMAVIFVESNLHPLKY